MDGKTRQKTSREDKSTETERKTPMGRLNGGTCQKDGSGVINVDYVHSTLGESHTSKW